MTYNPKQIVTRNIVKFDFDKKFPPNLKLINDHTNYWEIGDGAAQSGTQSIYITTPKRSSQDKNIYSPSVRQVSHFSFDMNIPKKALSAYLQFSYKGIGNAENAYLQIHQIELTAGASPGELYKAYKGEALGWDPEVGHSNEEGKSYSLQSEWMNEIIKLDISDYRNDSKKILFTWFNDKSEIAYNPAIAIDDLEVYCTLFLHYSHHLKLI